MVYIPNFLNQSEWVGLPTHLSLLCFLTHCWNSVEMHVVLETGSWN